ncbi:MAG: hypothetical protein JSR82_07820 [Verrucomicrobia bacterium]|nr:hypothetical protein [Verrucomicrobiota bacterium]
MGVADDLQLERRARELARIDGRQEPESRDYRQAREELVQSVPEVAPPEGHEELQAWDESPDAAGGRLPRVAPDDEMSPVELLIEEGLREADHDTRVAASEAAREEGGEQ